MNTLERKLPIGIQTFEKMRAEGCLYVDKTAIIYQIAATKVPYFLSRPRRFGKSLLISTFEAYFQGRKDLFEGLAIEKLETKWEQYPVLHLDLNAKKYETATDLVAMLNQYLEKWEAVYGDEKKDRSPEERFSYIIEQAYLKTGKGVVVLVDEYDKPLLQALLDENLLDEYRRILKAFYGVLKSSDRYLRFIFLTGVTKFAQVSVFSDLNQLNDISMKIPYANICGITKKELVSTFTPELERLAEVQEMSFEDTVDKMTAMYDGYHFTYSEDGLFNPFSVLNVFDGLMFDNYWFQTGTPTYLVDLLKQSDYDLRLLIDGLEVGSSGFAEYRAETKNPLPMIYQSGYLTIKNFDKSLNLTVFDTIDRVAVGDIRLKIRDILGAFMFGGEASDKKVKVLSGGERTRLAMIKLLLEPVNFLILDEPTNHLDMRSKDVLKEAIRDFDGTVIIVSHDRDFLDGLATKVYEFGGGLVKEHLGGIYDFLQKKQIESLNELQKSPSLSASPTAGKAASGNVGAEPVQPSAAKLSYEEQKELNKKLKKLERRVADCEAEIEQTEAAIAILEARMATPEGASDMSLYEQHQKLKEQLDRVMEEWDAATVELENH